MMEHLFFLCEECLGQAAEDEHLVRSKGDSSKGTFQTWMLRSCQNPGQAGKWGFHGASRLCEVSRDTQSLGDLQREAWTSSVAHLGFAHLGFTHLFQHKHKLLVEVPGSVCTGRELQAKDLML